MWEFYFKPFDKDSDGALTLDDFFENIVAFQDPEAREQGITSNKGLFDVLDLDGDGKIGLNEYAAFVNPLGVSEQDASTAFSQVDRDGDGFIERDEFATDLFSVRLTRYDIMRVNMPYPWTAFDHLFERYWG